MNIGSIYIPPIGKRLIIGAIVAVTTLGIVSILKSRDVSLSDV